MNTWMMNGVLALFALLASTGLFFFVVTRGALVVRGLSPGSQSEKSHVYPIYSNMRLIKLVDFQPIISAILLFQYHHLVSKIVSELKQLSTRVLNAFSSRTSFTMNLFTQGTSLAIFQEKWISSKITPHP